MTHFAAFLTKPVKQPALQNALAQTLSQGKAKPARTSSNQQFDSTLAARIPLKILPAEDNSVNQKLTLKLLERMGYRADMVSNGQEMLEVLEQVRYNLILMDVQMPEMDDYVSKPIQVKELQSALERADSADKEV